MNSVEFAEIIRAKRKKQGMTQAELAEKSGFTRVAINYWEYGKKSISLENADRLLKALGMKIIIKDEKRLI